MEMKALFRKRILLSGRGLGFAGNGLDLLARRSRSHVEILEKLCVCNGMHSVSGMYFSVVLLPPKFSSCQRHQE